MHYGSRDGRYVKVIALLCALAVTWWCVSAVSADWTAFRGPKNLGVSEEKNLPLTWSDSENVVWKTALPGPGSSSPILTGGKIFLTCCTGYGTGKDDDDP